MKRRYLLLYGGPIGDSLVGIHVGRTLVANVPGAVLELLSVHENPFVRELCKDLPFIEYASVNKKSLRSWFSLLTLVSRPCSSLAYHPVSYDVPRWWRIILWFARLHPGSIQLHYQMQGYEWKVPRGAVQRVYDCEKESFFDTPKTVLEAWGIEPENLPRPSLPPQPVPEGNPYLLFHFFAGQIRRSIPVAHARAILKNARAAYPKYAFVVTCAEKEKERAVQIVAGIADTRIESGHTPRALISLLCGARLVVGTASGILLIAANLQRPVISLTCLTHGKAFMPDFSPETIILAARNECRCRPGDGSACVLMTDEGPIYRCLYFITDDEVLAAMKQKLPA